jgi:hypothetical protein
MRRPGALALLATAAAGLLALVLVAASDKRDLAFTLGVVPTIPAAELRPDATVCQAPIDVPTAFSRVSVRAGGGPLALSVVGIPSGRVLGSGRVAVGPTRPSDRTASVGRIAADQTIGVCVRNAGIRRAPIYGNTLAASPLSGASIGKRELGTDVTVVFRTERRSMLAQLPDAFERASVFRPGAVGPWLFWVLAAAVLVGVPLLLARALSDSARAP